MEPSMPSANICHVISLPPRSPNSPYQLGYADGLRDGEKYANERIFWLGVAAGVLLSAVIVVAVLFFAGRL
jgi:hypothetical protein